MAVSYKNNKKVTIADMSAETQIRGTERFARLIASENLVIRHDPKISTPEFNTETRVIRVPILEGMSQTLYEGYLSHEVGHALYSPSGAEMRKIMGHLEKKGIPFYYLNVTEDARIEKILKRRFPGMIRSFGMFYKELREETTAWDHPFGLPVDAWSFIDRLNYRMKMGESVPVRFTPEEQAFVDRLVNDCETIDDAIQIAEELFAFAPEESANNNSDLSASQDGAGTSGSPSSSSKENSKKKEGSKSNKGNSQKNAPKDDADAQSKAGDDENGADDGSGTAGTSEDGDSSSAGPSGKNGDDSEDDSEGDAQGSGSSFDEEDGDGDSAAAGASENSATPQNAENSSTARSVSHSEQKEGWTDNAVKDYVKTVNGKNNNHNIIPDNIVLPRKFNYKPFIMEIEKKDYSDVNDSKMSDAKKVIKEFDSEITPVVSLMAQVFFQKQSASNYARQGSAPTGELDLRRLSKYKFTDDLFKRVTLVPQQKNHGYVMIIDWSSSMNSVTEDMICQTILLVRFWQRINVPFEVYLFSNADYHGSLRHNRNDDVHVGISDGAVPAANFKLIHIASSSWKKDHQDNVFAWAIGPGRAYQLYTPLEPALLIARYILEDFIKSHRLDKANFVFITDGDGNNQILNFNRETGAISSYRGQSSYIFDARTGINSYFPWEINCRNDGRRLLVALKNVFGEKLKIVGFFLCGDIGRTIKSVTTQPQSEVDDKFAAKNQDIDISFGPSGIATLSTEKGIGYDKFFILDPKLFKRGRSSDNAGANVAQISGSSENRIRAIVMAGEQRPARNLSPMAKEFVAVTA